VPGVAWVDQPPSLPPQTLLELYELGVGRELRHHRATTLATAPGSDDAVAVIGLSVETSQGAYHEGPPLEQLRAAQLLAALDEGRGREAPLEPRRDREVLDLPEGWVPEGVPVDEAEGDEEESEANARVPRTCETLRQTASSPNFGARC